MRHWPCHPNQGATIVKTCNRPLTDLQRLGTNLQSTCDLGLPVSSCHEWWRPRYPGVNHLKSNWDWWRWTLSLPFRSKFSSVSSRYLRVGRKLPTSPSGTRELIAKLLCPSYLTGRKFSREKCREWLTTDKWPCRMTYERMSIIRQDLIWHCQRSSGNFPFCKYWWSSDWKVFLSKFLWPTCIIHIFPSDWFHSNRCMYPLTLYMESTYNCKATDIELDGIWQFDSKSIQ